ncbi:MAG: acyltransferase family protein [Agitococcus sp.]|nr:acyltransferase family protein [Agitococcus sp.]
MNYRKDIQILRGVSVLLVVLFHLEIGFVKSGFLGVDVFFVISGFLMAILYDSNKKFDFFLRRANRLLPAYYVVILFVLIASIFITTPNDFNQVQNQSIFSVFFLSNVGYFLQNSYFSKVEFNLLLNLWSLGVEIQFYLLVPFLFFIFGRNKIILPLVIFLSLLLCFFIVGISPKTSFYMMPFRLWEFLIGYTVASYLTNNGVVKYTVYSWLGALALIIIIAIPFMNVDGQSYGFIFGHPGLYALFVSLATGVVLAFGVPRLIEDSKIGTILEVMGKYSYSVYLVHFPVIVLFLYKPFSGTVLKAGHNYQVVALIALIALLSFFMHRFIETSIRLSRKNFIKISILPLAIIFFSLIGPQIQKIKFSEKEMMISQAWEDRSVYRCGKLIKIMEPKAFSCLITHHPTKDLKSILLVGNSHADSIKTTFASVADSLNVNVYLIVQNDPLMQGGSEPERIISEAISKSINTIVLHYSPKAVKVSTIERLVKLANVHNIMVTFIMPVPTWQESIPKKLWENLENNAPLPQQSIADYNRANQLFYNDLLNITYRNFKIYPVGDIFCNEYCQVASEVGKPFYFDNGHLTLTGSEVLHSLFYNIINDTSHLATVIDET